MYVNYQEDNWSTCSHLAKFAYNNATHSATKSSPFFTLYARHPQFKEINPSFQSTSSNYVEKLLKTQAELKSNIKKANKCYKLQAHKSRLEPPAFKVGDKVWLNSENI